MTREEALAKVAKVCVFSTFNLDLVLALNALGLIKFDEPKAQDTMKHSSEKGKYIFFPSPHKGNDNVSVLKSDAVATMKNYGFKIDEVKKEELSEAEAIYRARTYGVNLFNNQSDFIKSLARFGYKVTKIA